MIDSLQPLWSTPVVLRLLGISARWLRILGTRAGVPTRYARVSSHPRKVRLWTSDEIRRVQAVRYGVDVKTFMSGISYRHSQVGI